MTNPPQLNEVRMHMLHTYVCMCVHVCMCMHVCMCVHVHVCMCMCACACVHVCACTVCVCLYATLCVGVHCVNSNNMCQRLMATALNVSSGVEHCSVPDEHLRG